MIEPSLYHFEPCENKEFLPYSKLPKIQPYTHKFQIRLRMKFCTLHMTVDSLLNLIRFSSRAVKTWDFQFEGLHLVKFLFF
jgi:hypothetical protein